MRDTAIVVPCFNEEKRLPVEDFLRFAKGNRAIHFILVNDCSTDRTGAVIDELSRRLAAGQGLALHLSTNLGKAGAVRAGFLEAFTRGYRFIGYWDADLATPLDAILTFRGLLDDSPHQMILGSRVRLLSHRIDRLATRHYLGRIFATLASLTLGVTVYDTQCGAKLFTNTAALRQVFAQPFTVSWIFDIEILARFILLARQGQAAALRDTAREYPLAQWRDVPGSKLKVSDFVKAAYELAKVWAMLHGTDSDR